MDKTRAEKSLIEQRFRARVITRARKRNHGNGDTQMHKSDVSACGNAHMEKGPNAKLAVAYCRLAARDTVVMRTVSSLPV